MKSKILAQKGYISSVVLLMLIAAASIAWMCCGVDWFDDLQYKRMPGEGIDFWLSEGPFITTFAQACEAVPYHFTVGSTRLPNLVQVFFNLVPPVLVDVMHGLMMALMMYVVVVVTGGRKALRSVGHVGVTALAVWVLLPWYDHMLPSVCQLNYVWVTVACLSFIKVFESDDFLPQRWKPLQWVVAALAGLMHEGFTFPIMAGAILVMMIDKHDRRRRGLLTLVLAVGALALFFTPGMFSRLEGQVAPQTLGHFIGAMAVSVLQLMSVYLLLLATAIVLWKRGLQYVKGFYRKNVMYVVIMVAGYALAIVSVSIRRGLWFVELASVILMLKLLFETFEWWRRPNVIMGAVAGLFTVVSISGVAVWQSIFSKEVREVCSQIEASGRPIAYVDLADPGNAPWWTFNVAQSMTSNGGNNAYCRHFGLVENKYILILPSRYKGKPVEQWDVMPGDMGAMGQFPYFVTTEPTNGRLLLTFGRHQSAATPLDRIISNLTTEDVDKGMVPTPYWTAVTELGDTLYCHNVNILGHAKRHRELLSIDANVGE